ncbi:MAG TPA: Uma2 family endonuclease [Humisphaera sp.]
MLLERIFSRKHPHSVVFRDASWRLYKAMLREFDEQPSRVNYDRGTLEIMTLSVEHEHLKTVLGMMIGLLALARRLKVMHGGSSTLKRLSRLKGLEADQCYWVANESKMRGKKRIDLRTDPPPDLVIEIDVMRAVVNREKIYAALGVPEMWVLRRRDGNEVPTLAAFALEGRAWVPIEHSPSFPFLRVADLNPFVARIAVDDDTSILSDFAAWARPLPEAGTRP